MIKKKQKNDRSRLCEAKQYTVDVSVSKKYILMPELLTRASCRKDWKRNSAGSSLVSPPDDPIGQETELIWTELNILTLSQPAQFTSVQFSSWLNLRAREIAYMRNNPSLESFPSVALRLGRGRGGRGRLD